MKQLVSPVERGSLLQRLLVGAIEHGRWDELKEVLGHAHPTEIAEVMRRLDEPQALAVFRLLPRNISARLFAYLSHEEQANLIESLAHADLSSLLGIMRPDDLTRVLDEMPAEVTRRLLKVLPAELGKSARELLGYDPGTAGRAMTTAVLSLPVDQNVGQALEAIQAQKKALEPSQVAELVDKDGCLVGEILLTSLLTADPNDRLRDLPQRPLIALPARMSREEVYAIFRRYRRLTLPVIDDEHLLLGVVTLDDIMHEAVNLTTRSAQRSGGMESLEGPYLKVPLLNLVRKRGGWLSVLFLSEMLTATAMGHYQSTISHAVVLALFVPLIISSGGNSGSQASTLIVRSLALSEVRLQDWWIVLRREAFTGMFLGTWLGAIGFFRVMLWQHLHIFDYGEHYIQLGLTIWGSLIGVVLFGGLAGSLMPLLLKKAGFDPATSSAPFVATLVDVTGLVIYFSVAQFILGKALT